MMKKQLSYFVLVMLLASCQFNQNTSASEDKATSNNNTAQTTESNAVMENSTPTVSSDTEPATEASTIPVLPGETLLWSDEFDGYDLDTYSWECQIGDGTAYGVYQWGNSEQEYYKSDNATVEDGCLVITAKKETQGSYNYTSARIRSKGKVSTTYGRIEARISMPAIQGLWPAFWMLPEDSYEGKGWPHSGEIDIMEAKGRLPNQSSSALHHNNAAGNGDEYQTKEHLFKNALNTTIEDFHVYGVYWTKDYMTFYVDDDEYFTVERSTWHTSAYTSNEDCFDKPFHVLINMAVGGHFDGYRLPPSDFTEAQMKVDYVRIYSID